MKAYFERALAQLPLVAILRGITPAEVEPVGDALADAGFRMIEIPLTSPDPFESIARLVQRLDTDVIVGAGTVRTIDDLDALVAVRGRLMVTPHADTSLIRAADSRGLATLPGVTTPTEAFAALEAGADGLKLYPADMIPPAAVAALRTVVGRHVALWPTGGIGPGDMVPYARAGATGFGLGGALYRPGQSAAGVAAQAKAFVTSWRALSSGQ
jgi:2-dehydro-3-deoxyphosphogalactonate aldolase